MKKNSQNFSMEDALRMAQTDAGKRLLAMVQASGGASLRQAASSGDPEAVKAALAPLLRSPELQSLLKELEDRHG